MHLFPTLIDILLWNTEQWKRILNLWLLSIISQTPTLVRKINWTHTFLRQAQTKVSLFHSVASTIIRCLVWSSCICLNFGFILSLLIHNLIVWVYLLPCFSDTTCFAMKSLHTLYYLYRFRIARTSHERKCIK